MWVSCKRDCRILSVRFGVYKRRSERASAPGIKVKKYNIKGIITIEAALAIPLFLFAVICLIYLIEVRNIRLVLHNASQSAAKETVEVPNLLDMSLSDVNSVASQYGLNVSVKGTSSTSGDGISTKQSIAEGTKVSEGTVITVTFSPQSGIAE